MAGPLSYERTRCAAMTLSWIPLSMAVAACSKGADSGYTEPVCGIEQAARVPPDFVDEVVVTGISHGTALAFAPDGRIFVAEQSGKVRVVKDDVLLAEPFAEVAATAESERGLLGLAVDPQFETNGLVYAYYTATSPTTHNRISRFRAVGDTAEGGETILFELPDTGGATIHNGGTLRFGPDGKLYVAVGDHGQPPHAQSLDSPFGKMLRLNPDGSIPEDNPFYESASGINRAVWASGLRNPFTFSFAASGRMFINDVGDGAWEEVNEGKAGANYGWPLSEGPTSTPGQTSPFFAYPHEGPWPTGCSIVGGAFYEPAAPALPSSFVGKYFYGDFCRGYVRVLDPDTGTSSEFIEGLVELVDLAVGPDGQLYRLERGTGSVARVRHAAAQPPRITAHPRDRTVGTGQRVTLSVTASGSEPFRYQWQRDGADLPGANAESYSFTASADDDGALFRVIVSNAHGRASSSEAKLAVIANEPPVVTIGLPALGTLYSAGETIAYMGSAHDAEDGPLPASALTWEVLFHHDTHAHPFLPRTAGQASGAFLLPRVGHTDPDVWYRVHLRARDSAGLESTTFIDLEPRLVQLVLQTEPAGLSVTLDGKALTTPHSLLSPVGVMRTLSARDPQSTHGALYQFASWSHGEPATHTLTIPAEDAVFTASFREVASSAPNLAPRGRPIADGSAATGVSGSALDAMLSTINDGVRPPPGNGSGNAQYVSDAARCSAEAWVGYTFDRAYTFDRLVFQEGHHGEDGGHFRDLTAEVLQDGSWVPVVQLLVSPPYPGDNDISYETFTLTFAPITGTGVRLFGVPGGRNGFVTVAELEVYEQSDAASAAVSATH